jgi:hypothetical protein
MGDLDRLLDESMDVVSDFSIFGDIDWLREMTVAPDDLTLTGDLDRLRDMSTWRLFWGDRVPFVSISAYIS